MEQSVFRNSCLLIHIMSLQIQSQCLLIALSYMVKPIEQFHLRIGLGPLLLLVLDGSQTHLVAIKLQIVFNHRLIAV